MAFTDDDITATNSLTVANKLTIREADFVSTFAEFLGGQANKGYIKGKFGVGTSNPANTLDVAGAASVGYSGMLAPTAGLIVLGDVGIGTSSPAAKLHVVGNARVSANLTVDGVFQGTIQSSNLASNAVQTVHLQNEAVTLEKIAAAARGIASIEGVSSPGGNIDLIPSNAITISGSNASKQVLIGESHSAVVGNPHGTTATQVGALAIAGGTLTGSLRINGNLGINTAAAHRLHVVAVDEPDNQSYGVVSSVTTGDTAVTTAAFDGNARSSGSTAVYGLNLVAEGSGSGIKFGVYAKSQGEGEKQGGTFAAEGASAAAALGVAGIGYNAGSGLAIGIEAAADGPGLGQKIGLQAGASGAEGTRVAGRFIAGAPSVTSGAQVRGIQAVAMGAGAGGVWGIDVDVSGAGVSNRYGMDCSVSGTGSGTRYGILTSVSASDTGNSAVYGMYASASNNNGVNTTFGLRCAASGSSTGSKYGIFSSVSGSGTLYAGYFQGNVHVSGTLSKTSGTFLIDHPLDPHNRVLRHNFVESPEELCLYRGKVQLDRSGAGVVKMPSYFVALTKEDDATITLTAIGRKRFLTSYKWNQKFDAFTVFGDPDAAVSYVVMAARDDPAVHKLRRPVEEDKTGEEKGQLLFPEAYPNANDPIPSSQAELQRMQAEEQRHAEERKQRREALQTELRSHAGRFQEQSAARAAAEALRLEKEARQSTTKPPSK